MRRNKKGQAAMEFLMTYGWAILVVLAAIGALAYFGVLNPGNWLPTKCTMQGGFSCLEYKASPNGTTNTQLFLRVQNNLGADATTANLTINSSDCTFSGQPYDMGEGATMQNGDTWTATLGCSPVLAVGDRIRGRMTVLYQKAGEQQNHEATGELSTKVES